MNIFELLTIVSVVGVGFIGGKEGCKYYGFVGGFAGATGGFCGAILLYYLFRKAIGVRK